MSLGICPRIFGVLYQVLFVGDCGRRETIVSSRIRFEVKGT